MHIGASAKEPVDEFWLEANRLRDMFKFEFFYSPTEEFNDDIRSELEFFDSQWEAKLGEGGSYAKHFVTQMTPLVAHASLRPYIESYRIVADVFARLNVDQTLDEKTAVAACFKYGRQAYLQRRISSKASIGEILFKNGYKLLDSYGLVQVGPSDLVEQRKNLSKSLRQLAHRLEHLRALAMPEDLD